MRRIIARADPADSPAPDSGRHRPVRLAVDELAERRESRRAHFVGRALKFDLSGGHVIDVVDQFERFGHVVSHDDRGCTEGVVEPPDQLADDPRGRSGRGPVNGSS